MHEWICLERANVLAENLLCEVNVLGSYGKVGNGIHSHSGFEISNAGGAQSGKEVTSLFSSINLSGGIKKFVLFHRLSKHSGHRWIIISVLGISCDGRPSARWGQSLGCWFVSMDFPFVARKTDHPVGKMNMKSIVHGRIKGCSTAISHLSKG